VRWAVTWRVPDERPADDCAGPAERRNAMNRLVFPVSALGRYLAGAG